MGKKISWIKVIDYEHAGAAPRSVYDSVHGPGGQLDNLYPALGLRPHILQGADQLYRAILHDARNSLAPWLAELIAAYVGVLNGCAYTTAHRRPDRMTERDVDLMRDAGIPDGDILEINLVAASFAYWARTVNGLGADLAGERLGYDA